MAGSGRHGSGLSVLVVAVLVSLVLCLWEVFAFRRADPYTTDGSYYQGLAENLASHRGYVFDFKPHTRYPPGFPVVLAVGGIVVGHDYTSYVRLMPLFGFAGLLSMLVLVAKEDRETVAAAACLLLASSPQFFRSATQDVLSDLPFFAVSGAALLAISRPRPKALLAAPLVVTAVMIRSAGIALVAAVLATLAWNWRELPPRTRRVLGLVAAAGVVAEIAWLAWSLGHAAPDWPGEPMDSYVRQLALKDPREPGLGAATALDIVWRVRDGLSTLAARSVEIATHLPWIAPIWFSPLVLFPIVLVGLGVATSIARRHSILLAWYVAAYCALYALWPFDEGGRFVVPIFPLVVMFGVRGAIVCFAAVESRPRVASFVPPVLAVLAAGACWSAWRDPRTGMQERTAVLTLIVLAITAFVLSRVRRSGIFATVHRLAPAAITVVVLVIVGAGILTQNVIASSNRAAGATFADRSSAMSVAAWLVARPDVDPVMAQQTAVFHRLTGRRTVSFPTVDDGDLVSRTVRLNDVAYMIVSNDETAQYYRPSERARFEALRAAEPDCCELAFANGGYRVYRIATRVPLTRVRSVLRQPY
ncbi:MAG TPA: hypothetical protein VH497_00940 [Vicinamibacterales bacterium]